MQNPRHGREISGIVPGMEFAGVLHGTYMSANVYPEIFGAIE
jgi:hypothetical protein